MVSWMSFRESEKFGMRLFDGLALVCAHYSHLEQPSEVLAIRNPSIQ